MFVHILYFFTNITNMRKFINIVSDTDMNTHEIFVKEVENEQTKNQTNSR